VTPDIEARARKIRLLVMDVDGVLTDGEKLGVHHMILGARRKAESAARGVRLGRVGTGLRRRRPSRHPALQRAAVAVAVADAVPEVKAVCHVVLQSAGGHGAVRECVELLLRARGVRDTTVDAYVRDHGGESLPQQRAMPRP
jgi:hypothetical protein